MARPLAETFRESVSHVDFFWTMRLTEPVEMPDSDAGLDYSDYVVRVEDRRVQPPGHFLVQSLNLGVQASDALQLDGQHAAPVGMPRRSILICA